MVPHQDVDALAAGMNQLIEDEELRRRCGAGALATAERYSIEVIGARWEELLASLAWNEQSPAGKVRGLVE